MNLLVRNKRDNRKTTPKAPSLRTRCLHAETYFTPKIPLNLLVMTGFIWRILFHSRDSANSVNRKAAIANYLYLTETLPNT